MDIFNRLGRELYFMTDTVIDWIDIFTRPTYKHIIIESLQYCQEQKKYLFEGRNGGKYNIRSAQKVFENTLKKAKINKETGIHGLRHSFATHLLEKGTDISYIQKLLGHNDVKTTLIYAQVAQKDLKRIKSPLDDL